MDLSGVHWFELDQLYSSLRREVRKRPEWRFGPQRVEEVAKEGYLGFSKHIDLKGKVYCDLGCGTFHPYGISAIMYLNGAKETIALDLNNCVPERAAEALADLIEDVICFPDKWNWANVPKGEFLERARFFNIEALREGDLNGGIRGLPLKHIVTDIHNPILAPESIDIMTSRATLEHFLDFPTAADRFLELLKPGGYAFHVIDVVDHRAYENPNFHFWSFLAEDKNWTDGVCNRLRPLELKKYIENSGFIVERFERGNSKPFPAEFMDLIAPHFKAMPIEDIHATGVTVLIRRPAMNENMEEKSEDPTISLPEVVGFVQKSQHDNGWSDHYGALYVAAAHCDIDLPETPFPHIWQHGCFGPWVETPELHFYNAPNPENKKIFVARQDEVELLKNAGYNNAHAIGLPVTYLPDLDLKRVPNSLLVMPQHTLVGMRAGTEEIRDAYIRSIAKEKDNFNLVTACISPSCMSNGMYLESLSRVGIEYVSGAFTADINACLRIKCLMEQFEYMTTNTWGSHVAYALYFGMKVSFYGDGFEVNLNDYLRDTTISSLSDEERTKFLNDCKNGPKEFFANFYSSPKEGKEDRKLGQWLVGEENKKSPEELAKLFGWT